MVRILDPELRIERVDDHPGNRRLVVTYELDVAPDDPAIGATVHEEAVVSARDQHDAPVLPVSTEFRIERDGLVAAGVIARRLEHDVHRVDLDVEQDWWDTDQAGGTKPIAEFADHLAAVVIVSIDDREIARADSQVVTGSWGALGTD